jgi:hypothetical protein
MTELHIGCALIALAVWGMWWTRRELRWLRRQQEEIRKLLTPNPTPCERPATPLRLVRSGDED